MSENKLQTVYIALISTLLAVISTGGGCFISNVTAKVAQQDTEIEALRESQAKLDVELAEHRTLLKGVQQTLDRIEKKLEK